MTRLVEQLQSLSRVAENLTVRLLELEERLADQENRLLPLLEAAEAADPAAMEGMDLRLGETEARLARVEAILRGAESGEGGRSAGASPDRSLRAVPRAFATELAEGGRFAAEADLLADPFPEEGEQPFMDERIA
jgi:hypothetical protein